MSGGAAARGTVGTIRYRLASLARCFGATTGLACRRRISSKGQRKDLHLTALLSVYFLNAGSLGPGMVTIGLAETPDREEIEKLIAEYDTPEGMTPIEERIAWAVDNQLRHTRQAYF